MRSFFSWRDVSSTKQGVNKTLIASDKKQNFRHTRPLSSRFKLLTWLTIVFQLLFPLAVSFTPAIAAISAEKTPVKPHYGYNNQQPDANEITLAKGLIIGGNLLSNDQSNKVFTDFARSKALGKANAGATQWLNQFGRAQVQLNLDDMVN